ncbi:hypothetical protein DPEC_G00282340 [Dallia pectoralis]|uniref:Uncharacterized protein n=1 Tax=Dallia pectoralis TaxID=75939 RepID=A0ACC2FN54_DALPE|nr:hypothetical protein DPEC_G00282340 [Dallia pectoralis]
MYARAVWVEHGKEVEGTAPDNWIDVDKKTIRWPKKGVKAAFLNQHAPKDDWMTFTLVKRKITSVNIRECDDYDMTSHVEEEEEENEEVEGRRKKTKRKFDDYVLGVIIKAPSFPIPPTKVTKSIQIESAGSSKNFTGMSHHEQSALSKYRSTGNYERSLAHESCLTPRRETDVRFPMAIAKFQKKVLTKLMDIHMEVRRLGRCEHPLSSAHLEQQQTMKEFEREEERLKDMQAFESLVLQLSRIGGKDVRDCVHKILDRLFTNRLMAKFNMKGKGKKQKLPLEATKTFEAIKAAVMKWDKDATEASIKHHAAEHLKHAPGRKGGGGHTGLECLE